MIFGQADYRHKGGPIWAPIWVRRTQFLAGVYEWLTSDGRDVNFRKTYRCKIQQPLIVSYLTERTVSRNVSYVPPRNLVVTSVARMNKRQLSLW